jgi:putative hemolysin
MSEIALTSSKKIRLEIDAKKGKRSAILALALASHPNKFLSTVQIGITIINIVLGIVGGEAYAEKIAPLFKSIPFVGDYAYQIATVINIIFIGFISIVFGEMIPKRIGLSKPETIAKLVALPMTGFLRMTRPFVWLLSITTDIFMRLLGIKMDDAKVTEEEIKAIIDEGATAGTIEEIEQDIVENVFHLGDKRVGTLMTNRTDIVWLDVHESIEYNLEIMQKHNHAVYPVCDEELDNVLGIVTVKDILSALLKKQPIDLRKMVRQVNYFPETMNAYTALEKFKESRIHQGLVVDEYGTMVGIVTINDLFDTLVGDISQEDGSIAYELMQREDGSWLIDGQYPWDDFLKEFDLDDDTHTREGFHTIGGFILHELEELPKTGEKLEWNNMTFEVIDMDNMRIDKVLIKRNN